jgi:hypothetical protein
VPKVRQISRNKKVTGAHPRRVAYGGIGQANFGPKTLRCEKLPWTDHRKVSELERMMSREGKNFFEEPLVGWGWGGNVRRVDCSRFDNESILAARM